MQGAEARGRDEFVFADGHREQQSRDSLNGASNEKGTIPVNSPDFTSEKHGSQEEESSPQLKDLAHVKASMERPLQALATEDQYQINNEIGFFQEQSQALVSLDVSEIKETPTLPKRSGFEHQPFERAKANGLNYRGSIIQ